MLLWVIIGRVILVEPCGTVVRDMFLLVTRTNLTLHSRVESRALCRPNGTVATGNDSEGLKTGVER